MILKRNRLFLLVLPCLFFCVVLLHKPLICALIKHVAIKKSFVIKESQISYKRLGYNKGCIYLEDLEISYPQENQQRLSIQKLEYHYDFKLSSWHFESFYRIIEPVIKLDIASRKKKLEKINLYDIAESLSHLKKVHIEKGRLEIHTAYGGMKVFFSFLADKDLTHLGEVLMGLDPSDPESFHISLDVYQKDRKILLEAAFHEAPIEVLQKSYFCKHPETRVKIEKGKIEGTLSLSLTPEGYIDSFQQEMKLHHLLLSYEDSNLKGEIEEARLNSYLPEHQEPFLFEQIFDFEGASKLVSNLDINGGKLSFVNKETQSLWEAVDLTFQTQWNLQQSPKVKMCGAIKKDAITTPFCFEGKGFLDVQNLWKIDLYNTFSEEEKKKKCISISLANLQKEEFLFKVSFDGLDHVDLEMIQDLLFMKYPSLAQIEIDQGELKVDFKVIIKGGHLQTVLLDHLVFSDVLIKDKEKKWEIGCKQMQGKIKLQLPLFNENKSSLYELLFSEAVFIKTSSDNIKQERFEGDGFLCYKDFKIAPSWVKIKSSGIQVESKFSGSFSEINTISQMEFFPGHRWTKLQELVALKAPGIEKLQKVDVCLKVKKNNREIQLLGNSLLNYGGDVSDKIQFGFEFSLDQPKNIWPYLTDISFEKGWFQSDKISPHTYLWFLQYYQQKWVALGEMKIKGELDRKKLFFDVEAIEAVYDSEDILVTMPKQSAPHMGFFLFDYKTKQWTIDLPIQGAKCLDKKFHLPFDKVFALVKIQGTTLLAERLIAECEQVQFKGEIHVDFANPEWIELKIYSHAIEGEIGDFFRFLRYIPEFQNMSGKLPLSGFVKGMGENTFFTQYSPKESKKQAKIALKVYDTTYPIHSGFDLNQMEFDLYWDSVGEFLEIKELKGIIELKKEQESRQYKLNVQQLICKNLLTQEWDFDLRVEGQTFDVLRLAGKTKKENEELHIDFKPNLNQFFGAKLEITQCALDEKFEIKRCAITSEFSFNDLMNQWQCCYLAHFFDANYSFFQKMKNAKAEGLFSLNFDYDASKQKMELALEGRGLIFNQSSYGDLNLGLSKDSHKWLVKHFKLHDLELKACVHLDEDKWEIDECEGNFKDSFFKVNGGQYREKRLELDVEKIEIPLEKLIEESSIPKGLLNLFVGKVTSRGRFICDVGEGVENIKIEAECYLFSDSMTKGALQLYSKMPLTVSFSLKEGLEIKGAHLVFSKQGVEEAWLSLDIRQLRIDPKQQTYIGKGVKISLPPEMLCYLSEQQMIPQMGFKEGKIVFDDKELSWDNQIETEFDFVYDENIMQLQGVLKDGYYWISGEPVYLQKCYYVLDQGQLNIVLGCDYKEVSLDILTRVQLKDDLDLKIVVKEGHLEGSDERTSLDIYCKSSSEEGVYIQTIEGTLYGVEAFFRRNSRVYAPHVMILTGQLKIDTAGLVKSFPKLFYQTIKDLGMGNGYELSGDWVISKKELKNSYFKGFLKGRDFEFLGFYFKTLMSEVELNNRSIMIHDFSLSDLSGVMQIKEVKVYKDEKKEWKIKIPEVTVQDFRPSFLKKHELQEEKIKPFVIKDLHFFNIEGTLGSKESFKGRGYLDFINTFKREMHILDIPIEIIGRLGFDLGIFIPVIGKLEFEMTEGRIFLRELKHAYSEGKRSRFYLSGYKDSFIGLDGNLFIDIKMKQYVLLKITEPFTLSIRGSLSKPRYSLR